MREHRHIFLLLGLEALVGQTLVAVGQVDDAAIVKSVFEQDVLQDVVVAVGIGSEVGVLASAPRQAGLGYAVALWGASQAVQGGVGLIIVEPLSLIDVGIGGIRTGDEAEGADELLLVIQAHVAVAVLDVVAYQVFSGIAGGPLTMVSVGSHNELGGFE